ncbi:hypothetical protein ACTU3I_14230 [Microbacterium sp. RD1]
MAARPHQGASDQEDAAEHSDVFAGLVPIDVVDGELLPRRHR